MIRSESSFMAWCVGKFLEKHHVKYTVRRHFTSSYFEVTMPTGSIRLIRVSDHKPNQEHPWQPDFCIYNQKDYRRFKSVVKKCVRNIWFEENKNAKA